MMMRRPMSIWCSATAMTNTITRLMTKVNSAESEAAMTRMERGK
jgi:hypothetical protein